MKPNNPFVISGYRGPEYFCDRVRETEKVVSALVNERNVTLMAPRRYGKTGLVRNVFHSLPEEYDTIYVDIYSTENLNEFTQTFASAVVGALDSAVDKVLPQTAESAQQVSAAVTKATAVLLRFTAAM